MDDHKEIRVQVVMDGTRYQYTQTVPLKGLEESPTVAKQYVAYAIASQIRDTIIERWEEN